MVMKRTPIEIPEKGFFYHHPSHKYYLNGVLMTGITTILKVAGDASNLIQWAANQAASKAILEATSIDITAFAKSLASYKKLDTPSARELDRLFPGFKSARTYHLTIRDNASDVGKEGHSLCEDFERGLDISSYPTEAQNRAKPYLEWYKNNVEKTYFVERPLFSSKLFTGGTPDGGFKLKDGRNLINDKKFKEYLYDPSPFWQMAAYRFMLEEMSSDDETQIKIDWGDKIEEYKNPKEYLESFGFVDVMWHGAVVIRIGTKDLETMFCDTYTQDLEGFMAAHTIYRQVGEYKKSVMEASDA